MGINEIIVGDVEVVWGYLFDSIVLWVFISIGDILRWFFVVFFGIIFVIDLVYGNC